MYEHTCLTPGCGAKYKDQDEDAYYCDPCKERTRAIAAEVDAKHPRTGPIERPMTDLDRYDAATKIRGFASAADIL